MAEFNFTQELPKSEIVEAGYLEKMLDNFASSYKLFWFRGIYIEIRKGNRTMDYKRVVARMIAAAWYPVVFYKLSLGVTDKLADAVWYLYKELHINREEKEEKIVEFICESQDKKLLKMIHDFTKLVPYRLIRPFYQREIDYERRRDVNFYDGKVNPIIESLTVSEKWAEYISINASVVEGWV